MQDSNEYQRLALRTEKQNALYIGRNDRHQEIAPGIGRLLHAEMGLTTETGELVDQIKKHLIYGKPLHRTNVLEECGDILWYIALALDSQGYSLSQCMDRNIAKLLVRFPDQYSDEHALTRNLAAEMRALDDDDFTSRG